MDESIPVLVKNLKRLRCHVHATAIIFDFSIVNCGASIPVANLHKSRAITGSPPRGQLFQVAAYKNRVKSGNPLSWNF